MFSKLFFAASFAILAVATPVPNDTPTANACCDSTTTAGAPSIATLLASIGVPVQNANVPIGLGCSPITVVGVSGTSCTSQAVSCDQVFTPSLVGLNCVPADVSL